jgi:hypothetical protein
MSFVAVGRRNAEHCFPHDPYQQFMSSAILCLQDFAGFPLNPKVTHTVGVGLPDGILHNDPLQTQNNAITSILS